MHYVYQRCQSSVNFLFLPLFSINKFNDTIENYFVFPQGKSPYLRSTYRYPPVIAWMMTPNILVSSLAGKLIFVVFDILVGDLIFKIVKNSGYSEATAKNCSLTWLLNPLPAAVSTRGSAESVMAFMVLQSLDFLLRKKIVAAAFFYALSVHLKIYPITYALSIYLYLGSNNVSLVRNS